MSIFFQAVVTDVILDPSTISPQQALDIDDQYLPFSVDARMSIKNAPRNTLFIRSIHGIASNVEAFNDKRAVFPFFSSHLCTPVKPGEVVWVFDYDQNAVLGRGPLPPGTARRGMDFGREIGTTNAAVTRQTMRTGKQSPYGFWMGRVSSIMQAEDINYTVYSRKYALNETDVNKIDGGEGSPGPGLYFRTDQDKPSIYSNGDCTTQPPNFVFPGSADFFKTIFDEATANGIFEQEPVPRYTSRPGDMVIQGSNNTLISMTTDRVGPYAKVDTEIPTGLPVPILTGSDDSKPEGDFFKFSGTIDMVTGRGREIANGSAPSAAASYSDTTAPPIIDTDGTRGATIMEVDKHPNFSNTTLNSNPAEGDPDFMNDSSRLYLSMRTNGDVNFNIPYPEKTDNCTADLFGDDSKVKPVPADDKGAAYAVLKADEIRIVARKADENLAGGRKNLKINPDSNDNANGSIKIVKEGAEGDDLAAIIINPDGTIQIDTPKIIIGRNDSNTAGEDQGGKPGYVKFSEYHRQMSKLHDEVSELAGYVKDYATSALTQWTALNVGLNSALGFAQVPLAGGQSAAGSAASGMIEPATSLKTNAGNVETEVVPNLKNKIPDARSDTIFGE